MLSLIVFDFTTYGTERNYAKRLASSIVDRVRMTDEVGLLDSKRIGVILPFTGIDGARLLAEEIISNAPFTKRAPECTIHTYPSNWWTDNKYISNQLDRYKGPLDCNSRLEDISLSMKVSTERSDSTTAKNIASEVVFSKSIKRLEPLVTCAMPTWKRQLDLLGSAFAFALFSPVFLGIALLIKAVSPGPVFFRQKRLGYLGKTYNLLKFRTMHVNADSTAHEQLAKDLITSVDGENGNGKPMKKIDNDPRIIPFGRMIRNLCIDELPQLINVVRGEMSLVGPRPCLGYEAAKYRLWNAQRFNTIPGMTGLWQVKGKNRLSFDQMIRFDITYARKKSIWFDLNILFMTFFAIATQIRDLKKRKKA